MTIKEILFRRKRKEGDTGGVETPENGTRPERTGTIGKYEIIEKIGHGGFGMVYKAFDPLIKRHVAVKTCEVGNKDIRSRFFREAQLAGGLQHPNITLVYEFGFEGDVPYMVQEFLSGEDLDRMIKRGAPLSLQEKLKILVGIAFGLEYAHRAGVIHRDVKPANVRVLDGQGVKIMDFGIAKSVDPADDITQTGITVGSSSYMSPEQIGGDVVDFRTDIFSFGVLAYELFAYRKPFRNENLFLLLEQIVKEEPPPLASLVPDLPPSLLAVVEKAMKKGADERFQSTRDLRNALVAVQQEIAPSEVVPGVTLESSEVDQEAARLHALDRLEILETEPEPEFDDLAQLAAQLCGTPFAYVAVVDRDREWLKARVGISVTAIPRSFAFSPLAIPRGDVFVVEDATSDPRFAENPLVVSEPGVRFCAAAPVTAGDGPIVGAVAVLDRNPRSLEPSQLDALRALARQASSLLELRRLRRAGREQSGEKLILEVAGLSDSPGAAAEKPQ